MGIEGKSIAVPGKYTTANLLLKLAVDDFQPVEMRFDEVLPAVKRGEVDAGLVIHEGQITYSQHGLVKILNLWNWWYEKTKLPMPLGINAIKRDVLDTLSHPSASSPALLPPCPSRAQFPHPCYRKCLTAGISSIPALN